jgi:hypothetical protein
MTDDSNDGMETINTKEIEATPKEEPPIDKDIDEADSIQKPPKKKGRPPLSQKQKDALALGRAKSRRNMQKLMAEEKLRKIAEEEGSNIDTVKEESQKEVKPTVNKKKAKKKVIIESESDSSEDEIVYVSKKKKKKPKKKIIIESSSEDDDSSDEEYTPQPPIHSIQPRGLIFR